jgi:hypothetical protein
MAVLARIPVEKSEHSGYVRAANWRPLRKGELKESTGPVGGRKYFEAIPEDVEPYYWEADA